MLDNREDFFISGESVKQNLPLERYLPPIKNGVVSSWLKNNLDPGGWILDPYGSHPLLPMEAARAGYNVLMACNNPIIRLLTEVLSVPPSLEEYRALVSELLTLKWGDNRLEQVLQALYETTCPACGSIIQAEAFLWKKEENEPFAKMTNCSYCGDKGEKKLSLEDKERLRLVGNEPLFWRRAISRVASEEDEISDLIAEAIKVYLPRQLYFIMTLLNKSESTQFDDRKRKLIRALLLLLFDRGNILWNWPTSRTRPKSLVTPSQFREDNLWLEIVNSHQTWATTQSPIEIKVWPELTSGSGICIFPGRLKDLSRELENLEIKAILAAIPRPNQAFWTLSAIWSGWLWGRNAVTPLKSAIERRRYDWKWHTYALHSINGSLIRLFNNPVYYFGIISELVPRFYASVTASSCSPGFGLNKVSFRDQEEEAQITWQVPGHKTVKGNLLLSSLCVDAINNVFTIANEPLSYNQLHTYFFSVLGTHNYFDKKDPPGLGLQIDQAETTLHKLIGDPGLFRRYGTESQNLESGLFWPREKNTFGTVPLSDRVEAEVFLYAERERTVKFKATDSYICSRFPGITTPASHYVRACLESYCTYLPNKDIYEFNEKDLTVNRENEISEIEYRILAMAEKLGYKGAGTRPIQWIDKKGRSVFDFYLSMFASIGEFLLNPVTQSTAPDGNKLIIFPGSRSSLVSLRLKQDLRLSELSHGWKLVKFRQIRRILNMEGITLEDFSELIEKDPVSLEGSGQPPIFNLQS